MPNLERTQEELIYAVFPAPTLSEMTHVDAHDKAIQNSVTKDAVFTDEWGAKIRSSRVAIEEPQDGVAHALGQKSSCGRFEPSPRSTETSLTNPSADCYLL